MNYEQRTTNLVSRHTKYEIRATKYEIRYTKYDIRDTLHEMPSTYVENPLQISSFYTNKPNLLDAQMNLKSFHAADYENKSNWKLGENKPNTNPLKPNFRKAKMDVSVYVTKDYENETAFSLRENKLNQTQSQTLHTLAHFLPIFSYLSHPNPTSQPTRPHFCAKNDDLPSKTQDFIEESVHLIQNSPVKTHPFGHTPPRIVDFFAVSGLF